MNCVLTALCFWAATAWAPSVRGWDVGSAVVLRVAVFRARVFLCVRPQGGSTATLLEAAWPDTSGGSPARPFVGAYGSLAAAAGGVAGTGGVADPCASLRAAAAADVETSRSRLWVLDGGDERCPPQIFVYDLRLNKEVWRCPLPEVPRGVLASLTVDGGGPHDARAYLGDSGRGGLIVASLRQRRYWFLDITAECAPVGGVSIRAREIALSRKPAVPVAAAAAGASGTTAGVTLGVGPPPQATLYITDPASEDLFALPLGPERSRQPPPTFSRRPEAVNATVQCVGNKLGPSLGLASDYRAGLHYFLPRDLAAVRWDTRRPLQAESHEVLLQDIKLLPGVSQIFVGPQRNVWALIEEPSDTCGPGDASCTPAWGASYGSVPAAIITTAASTTPITPIVKEGAQRAPDDVGAGASKTSIPAPPVSTARTSAETRVPTLPEMSPQIPDGEEDRWVNRYGRSSTYTNLTTATPLYDSIVPTTVSAPASTTPTAPVESYNASLLETTTAKPLDNNSSNADESAADVNAAVATAADGRAAVATAADGRAAVASAADTSAAVASAADGSAAVANIADASTADASAAYASAAVANAADASAAIANPADGSAAVASAADVSAANGGTADVSAPTSDSTRSASSEEEGGIPKDQLATTPQTVTEENNISDLETLITHAATTPQSIMEEGGPDANDSLITFTEITTTESTKIEQIGPEPMKIDQNSTESSAKKPPAFGVEKNGNFPNDIQNMSIEVSLRTPYSNDTDLPPSQNNNVSMDSSDTVSNEEHNDVESLNSDEETRNVISFLQSAMEPLTTTVHSAEINHHVTPGSNNIPPPELHIESTPTADAWEGEFTSEGTTGFSSGDEDSRAVPSSSEGKGTGGAAEGMWRDQDVPHTEHWSPIDFRPHSQSDEGQKYLENDSAFDESSLSGAMTDFGAKIPANERIVLMRNQARVPGSGPPSRYTESGEHRGHVSEDSWSGNYGARSSTFPPRFVSQSPRNMKPKEMEFEAGRSQTGAVAVHGDTPWVGSSVPFWNKVRTRPTLDVSTSFSAPSGPSGYLGRAQDGGAMLMRSSQSEPYGQVPVRAHHNGEWDFYGPHGRRRRSPGDDPPKLTLQLPTLPPAVTLQLPAMQLRGQNLTAQLQALLAQLPKANLTLPTMPSKVTLPVNLNLSLPTLSPATQSSKLQPPPPPPVTKLGTLAKWRSRARNSGKKSSLSKDGKNSKKASATTWKRHIVMIQRFSYFPYL